MSKSSRPRLSAWTMRANVSPKKAWTWTRWPRKWKKFHSASSGNKSTSAKAHKLLPPAPELGRAPAHSVRKSRYAPALYNVLFLCTGNSLFPSWPKPFSTLSKPHIHRLRAGATRLELCARRSELIEMGAPTHKRAAHQELGRVRKPDSKNEFCFTVCTMRPETLSRSGGTAHDRALGRSRSALPKSGAANRAFRFFDAIAPRTPHQSVRSLPLPASTTFHPKELIAGASHLSSQRSQTCVPAQGNCSFGTVLPIGRPPRRYCALRPNEHPFA